MRRKVISRMLFDRVKRFSKDEAGGMLVLMLVVFFGITIFGGLAVDLANHERTRTTSTTPGWPRPACRKTSTPKRSCAAT